MIIKNGLERTIFVCSYNNSNIVEKQTNPLPGGAHQALQYGAGHEQPKPPPVQL